MKPRRARAVLGIDAAWTVAQPSGVAVVVEREGRWRCAAVAPGHAELVALSAGTPVDWRAPDVSAGEADVPALLTAARRLAPGAELAAVAVDMPLARRPIRGRRPSDDLFSSAYGARGLGVHTPTALRPGAVADRLRRAFERNGYVLATAAGRGARSLVEVYPHAAAIALLGEPYRVKYKLARARRYWPDATPDERRAMLLRAWDRILRALRRRIAEIDLPLPRVPPASGRMKRYEDALDAVVCAWVGIEFLEGRARGYGDADAAIWTPG